MFRVTITSEGDDWLDNLEQAHRHVSDAVQGYTKQELQPLVNQRVDATLRREPPVFRGKRTWNSEKQRRAYFATDGFGHGIPYRRTGQYPEGWRVLGIFAPDSSAIVLFHPWTKAKYVVGFRQQEMHKISGWTFAPGAIQSIVLEVEDRVIRDLPGVIDQAFEELA